MRVERCIQVTGSKSRTFQLYTNPVRHRLDSLCPQGLVQLWVDPDVCRGHGLLSKCNDRLDGGGCTLLEGTTVDTLVEVDGVLSGDDVLERGASLARLCRDEWLLLRSCWLEQTLDFVLFVVEDTCNDTGISRGECERAQQRTHHVSKSLVLAMDARL